MSRHLPEIRLRPVAEADLGMFAASWSSPA
jgi:hypothetical protein